MKIEINFQFLSLLNQFLIFSWKQNQTELEIDFQFLSLKANWSLVNETLFFIYFIAQKRKWKLHKTMFWIWISKYRIFFCNIVILFLNKLIQIDKSKIEGRNCIYILNWKWNARMTHGVIHIKIFPPEGLFSCKSNSISYEKFCAKNRFETEVQGDSALYTWLCLPPALDRVYKTCHREAE